MRVSDDDIRLTKNNLVTVSIYNTVGKGLSPMNLFGEGTNMDVGSVIYVIFANFFL